MGFDGSIYVDTHVNCSRPHSLHYSVQGLFYLTQDTGVLFHYSTEHTEEVILWDNNGKFRIYRELNPSKYSTTLGTMVISVNTWYAISFSVGANGLLYVNINGTRDIHRTVGGERHFVEIPGRLRIGTTFDGSQIAFSGIIACVGFYWHEREPLVTELLNLCKTPHGCVSVLYNDRNYANYSST